MTWKLVGQMDGGILTVFCDPSATFSWPALYLVPFSVFSSFCKAGAQLRSPISVFRAEKSNSYAKARQSCVKIILKQFEGIGGQTLGH